MAKKNAIGGIIPLYFCAAGWLFVQKYFVVNR
jgi:hypothetical protein